MTTNLSELIQKAFVDEEGNIIIPCYWADDPKTLTTELQKIIVDVSSTNSAVNNHESGLTTVSTTGDDGLVIIEQITKHLQSLYNSENDKSDAKLVNEAIDAVDRYRTRKAEEHQIKIPEESTTKGPEQI